MAGHHQHQQAPLWWKVVTIRPSILKGDIVTGIIPVIPLDSEWYSTDNRLGGVQGGRGGGEAPNGAYGGVSNTLVVIIPPQN